QTPSSTSRTPFQPWICRTPQRSFSPPSPGRSTSMSTSSGLSSRRKHEPRGPSTVPTDLRLRLHVHTGHDPHPPVTSTKEIHMAYEDTSVSVSKSQESIRKLLRDAGSVSFAAVSDIDPT